MTKQLLVILTVVFLGLSSCGNGGTAQAGGSQSATLNATEFNEKLNATADKQIIDVRTPEEFAGGHLKDAQNINIYDQDFAAQLEKLDKSKPVFVYCKGGGRSAKAAEQMNSMGFKTVFDMSGGMMAWVNNNLPVETGNAAPVADKYTSADFKKLMSENKAVLVDYYAPWCQPCKQMEPTLEKLKTEFAGKVAVVRINVDEAKALSKELSLEAVPVLAIYKDGAEVKRVTGLQSEEDLRKLIAML